MKSIIGNAPLLSASHLGPGVYFLLAEDGSVLYIGKSKTNCMSRVVSHRAEGRIPFYSYHVVALPLSIVNSVEAYLIASIKPEMNTDGVNANESHKLILDYWDSFIYRLSEFIDYFPFSLNGHHTPATNGAYMPIIDGKWMIAEDDIFGRSGGVSFFGKGALNIRNGCLMSTSGSDDAMVHFFDINSDEQHWRHGDAIMSDSVRFVDYLRQNPGIIDYVKFFSNSYHELKPIFLFRFEFEWIVREIMEGNVSSSGDLLGMKLDMSRFVVMP